MYWFIIMCVVAILIVACSKKDSAAKAKFKAVHPKEDYASAISEEVKELLHNGQRIQAIKQFRQETGLGLKDAKEILDELNL